MGLTILDILVLLLVGGGAVLGGLRGFVTETLSLFAWVAAILAVKLFHAPVTQALADRVATPAAATAASRGRACCPQPGASRRNRRSRGCWR